MKMPFGKFKGWNISALEPPYLEWLKGLDLREPLRAAVDGEWARRFGNAPTQSAPPQSALPDDVRTVAREIVDIGVRSIAARIEAVGEDAEVKAFHQAVEALKRVVEDDRVTTAGTTR